MEAVAEHYKFKTTTPWSKMKQEHQDLILYGSDKTVIPITYKSKNDSSWKSNKVFEGVIPSLERRLVETDSNSARDNISRYQTSSHCETCEGMRLKPQALAVKIGGKHISEISSLSIEEADEWFKSLIRHPDAGRDLSKTKKKDSDLRRNDTPILTSQQFQIAEKILKEINERLTFLMNVGLDYLSLSRSSATLSGGESQRIRLASQIGSGLTGVLYVLDEPSIGLHQRDNHRLLETLRHLRDLGNTVLVVEHDEDAIMSADFLIDIGPGAGVHGGEIIAKGTPKQVMKAKNSITADYLTGRRKVPIPPKRRKGRKGQNLQLIGATGNNLQNITGTIPLGTMTCITGVSGSGKSTFTIDTLYRAASQKLMKSREMPLPYKEIKGLEFSR